MKYGKIDGPVYCRYARTEPVINSQLASELGIQARLGIRAQHGLTIEVGKPVKLRMVFDNRKRRMTCHAFVDWVEEESSGEYRVGFSKLSLSKDEFKVLLNTLSDWPDAEGIFGDTVRWATTETAPVTTADDAKEILRNKAVTLPVGLIEKIDEIRGETPFSEFVVGLLRQHVEG
ncbi:MAG: hypothetical protein JRI25_16245 [Deltaproteobacteria bacterium]|nr:hypothetical protein [Deltaproteobacteria bacterium]MBW2256131.1 hypothetical protein [Deltaproteobacteria bacterium]